MLVAHVCEYILYTYEMRGIYVNMNEYVNLRNFCGFGEHEEYM